MKENIKYTSQIVLLLHLCTSASGLFIYFLQYFKELEFAIRQTHVHELNKNDMKLELASCHESTNTQPVVGCLYLVLTLLCAVCV